MRKRHPRIGGFLLSVTEEPQHVRAWKKGADGELRLGNVLDALAGRGVRTIHDRKRPGTSANIDHIAVSAMGVSVIDAKFYNGVVTRKDIGGWFRTDWHLFVGRRDCTKLVEGIAKQIAAVEKVVDAAGLDVPVVGRLCFVEAEWSFFAKPFTIDGVWVSGPKSLSVALCQPGPLTSAEVDAVAACLDSKLRPS